MHLLPILKWQDLEEQPNIKVKYLVKFFLIKK